jgi:hypothetical protein
MSTSPPVARRPWLAVYALLQLTSLLTAASAVRDTPALVAASLLLAIIVPGLAVVFAALSRDSIGSPINALALAVVVSAGIYILAGLALTALGQPLTHRGFAILVDGVVVAACAWSLVRGRAVSTTPARVRRLLADWAVPLASLAAAGMVVGFMASLPGADPMPYQAVYATGAIASAGGLVPVKHGSATVRLAVANHTGSGQSYRLQGLLNDGSRWRSRVIAVAAGQTWRGQLSGRVRHPECPRSVRVNVISLASQSVATDLQVRFRQPTGRTGLPC